MTNQVKVYMATQGNKTVGIKLDLGARKATKFVVNHEGTTTRISALESLLGQLKLVNFEESKMPTEFFMNDHLIRTINEGQYKNWLITGVTHEGELIEEEELKMWEEFHMIYCTNNLYIILKSTSKARLSEGLLKMEGKTSKKTGKVIKISIGQKQDDKYSSLAWDKLKELVGDVSYDIDESQLG